MKVHQEKNEIESSGDLAQANFGLEFNPKIARMLSEQVYSDPILAVVREYICNAWDAHTMVGNALPIQVRIPSALDPTWAVRDFGPGLSQAQIMGTADNNWRGLFNTYGKSGKDHSDQFIGGFGIGSKAGFAYTRQDLAFTITAWHEGIKNTFTASMNVDGIPQLMLMACEASNEPSGVEICIPVKTKDISTFVARTQTVCAYAPVKPDIQGGVITWQTRTYVQSGNGWRREKVAYDYSRAAVVLIGNIAYPLDDDQFTGDSVKLLNGPLELDVPIGCAELSLDRESLSYDARTVEYVQGRLDAAYKEVVDLYQKQLDSLPTYWDKCLAYSTYCSDCINSGNTVKQFKHKGKTIARNFSIASQDLPGVEYSYSDKNKLAKLDSTNIRYASSISTTAERNVYIVWNDCSSARVRPKFYRLYEMLKDKPYVYIYVVKTSSRLKFNKARARMGWPANFIHLNTLEDLYPESVTESKVVRDKSDLKRNVMVLSSGYNRARQDYFRQKGIDFACTDTVYYTWVNNYYLFPNSDCNEADKISPQQFLTKVKEALDELGHKVTIYCISCMYECHIANRPKFINIHEYVKSLVPDKATLDAAGEFEALSSDVITKFAANAHYYMKGCDTYKTTNLYKLLETRAVAKTSEKAWNKVRDMQALHDTLKTGVKIIIPDNPNKLMVDFEKYPMLKVVDSFYSYNSERTKIIANYIKDCEKDVSLQSA